MTLGKEDIATAKEMAQTLQKSRNSELIVVGNLLSHLLAERVAPQRTWVGLTDEEIKAFDTWHDNREEEVGWVNPSEIVAYIETKLKEKNT